MKRIGLTQRVEVIPSYSETRDCLDQRWAQLITMLGWLPIPLMNAIDNVETYAHALNLDGVILTGGNDLENVTNAHNVSTRRDIFERELVQFCIESDIPVLGVCRGAQHLALLEDSKLKPVDGHVATVHPLIIIDTTNSMIEVPDMVNSYHNNAILDLNDKLQILATDPNGHVEAFQSIERKLYGIMWHPERETPFRTEDIDTLKRIFAQ